jgi:translation initiation factor IF-3
MIRHHQPQANNSAAGGKNALPRDFQIKSQFVQVRNEENGRLSEPQLTSEVLKGLDLQKYSLAAVVMPKPPTYGQEGGGGPMYPICRIVDKKAELNAQMEKAKAARKKAVSTKEVEINWAIAPHDLDTRLKRLKTFLGKGMHVELTLMKQKKRNKRQASADEAKEVMAKVKDAIEKISGTKEYKASEGTVGGVVRMFLKGPNDYVPAAAEGEEEEEE